MALLPNGISYQERDPGSPEERIETEGATATRIFDVAWNDRVDAAKAILGYPEVVAFPVDPDTRLTMPGSGYISRNLPMFHPGWRSLQPIFTTNANARGSSVAIVNAPMLWATKITRIQGLGITTGKGTDQFDQIIDQRITRYNKARLTVNFETLPYEVLTDSQMRDGGITYQGQPDESYLQRYCTIKTTPNVTFLTVNRGAYKYVDPPAPAAPDSPASPVDWGTAKALSSLSIAITWHQVPRYGLQPGVQVGLPCSIFNTNLIPGTGFIEQSLGKMNSVFFAGFRPGTLLLMSAEIKPYRNVFVNWLYNITYTFKYFEQGHAFVFRPMRPANREPAWIEVTTNGTTNLVAQVDGRSIYDWVDFRRLFRLQ